MGLNLLPEEYKKKIATRMYIKVSMFLAAFIVIVVGLCASQYLMAKVELNNINKDILTVNELNAKIKSLENSISNKQEQLNSANIDYFEFDTFMKAIYQYKPASVTIISLDSQDRLIMPVDEEEGSAKSSKDNRSDAKKAADANKEATSGSNGDETKEDTDKSKTAEELIDMNPLTDKEIVLRGFSTSTDDIANYVYKISYLDCVSDIQLTSIEERQDNRGNTTKVFELVIQTIS